jgi:hypothetical protein
VGRACDMHGEITKDRKLLDRIPDHLKILHADETIILKRTVEK